MNTPRDISISVNRNSNFSKTYFKLISVILNAPLTELEIDILTSVENAEYAFTTKIRKDVVDDLKISKDSLNNYLRSLRQKGYLTENNKLMPTLIPSIIPVTADTFTVTLSLK